MTNTPPVATGDNQNAPQKQIDPKDYPHNWVVAATIPVEERVAKHAAKYLTFPLEQGTKVNALSVYCSGCRRDIADARDQACAAKISNKHLIGGDQDHRKKRRKPAQPNPDRLTVMPGPRIQRRGIDAVIDRVA